LGVEARGQPVVTDNSIKKLPENQLYFRIGEVAEYVDTKPYVLRYWESEFDWLKPEKSKMNQRQYSREDVELVELIARLLHKERYTIEGARKLLAELKGNWKAGLDALEAGLTPGQASPRRKDPASKELKKLTRRFATLERKYSSLEKEFVSKDRELKDLKSKHAELAKEVGAAKRKKAPFHKTLEKELKALRALTEEEAPSGPSMRPE